MTACCPRSAGSRSQLSAHYKDSEVESLDLCSGLHDAMVQVSLHDISCELGFIPKLLER